MSDDFDWPTLIHLLANQPIVSADLENNRDLILLEHQLYGIDAPTMKTLVLRSIDLQTNHFYNIVYSSTTKVAEKEAPVTNGNSELTSKDQELLATAKDYSPVEFLQVLKGQTGGYVTSGERHILTGLVAQEKLTQDAINILTWYVISDRGNSTKKNKWRKTIKEPMPAWSKKDTSELMKKASSQEIAKLRERIANRKKK